MVNLPIKTTKKNAILINREYLPDSIFCIRIQNIQILQDNPTYEYKKFERSELDIWSTDIEFQEKFDRYLTSKELMERIRKLLEWSRSNHIERVFPVFYFCFDFDFIM